MTLTREPKEPQQMTDQEIIDEIDWCIGENMRLNTDVVAELNGRFEKLRASRLAPGFDGEKIEAEMQTREALAFGGPFAGIETDDLFRLTCVIRSIIREEIAATEVRDNHFNADQSTTLILKPRSEP